MGHKLLDDTKEQCIAETAMRFQFKPSRTSSSPMCQQWRAIRFSAVVRRAAPGAYHPDAPVLIVSNRYDPLVPWAPAAQLGRDWCAQGADVQFWTNEQPPLFSKLVVNHALPMFVDGERAMRWIADRFNGLPTTPNCGQF